MLGLAILFFTLATGAPAFGYMELASHSLGIAQVLFAIFMVVGLLALVFHKPVDRVVLHREATSV